MRELKGNWKDLFRLFRVALDLPKVFLASSGTLLTILILGGWNSLLAVFTTGWTTNQFLDKLTQKAQFPPYGDVANLFASFLNLPVQAGREVVKSTTTSDPLFWLWAFGGIFLVILIWSNFGNAISRLAAFELTRDERIEMREATEYASSKFGANFMSFLLPAIGFGIFGLVIYLVALLINIPYLNALVMLGLPLAGIGGFIMVLILIGTATGFPLFFPSIAVEGTDSFDAISRGFSYVLSRPWHYLWYWLTTLVYGTICTLFVWFFALLMLRTVNTTGIIAVGSEFKEIVNLSTGIETPLHVSLTGWVYYSWVMIFELMAFSYAVSFFFSGSTLIYLLMRKNVDGIETEEIYEEVSEEEEIFYEEPPFDEDEEFDEGEFEEDEFGEGETEEEQEEASSTGEDSGPEEASEESDDSPESADTTPEETETEDQDDSEESRES